MPYPLPVVNDILQMRVRCQMGVQAGINVSHWMVTNVLGTPETYEAILLSMETAFAAAYKALLADDAQYVEMSLQMIYPTPVRVALYTNLDAGDGTAGTPALPGQVSGLISRHGALANRRSQGRLFIPFPSEADNGAGAVPTAGYVARLLTLKDYYVEDWTEMAGGNRVDLTPVLAPADLAVTPVTVTPVESGATRPFWATQKRRGSFGRANPL